MSLLRFTSSLRHTVPIRRAISTSSVNLSGHNKWSKIKEKKGANDAHKGALFSRATRDIAIAVRSGGSIDPERNVALATVIKRVKSMGVPKDNIENALKKAAGGKERGDQHLTYEAMAPGSVGLIIECISDNVNRTMHAVRNILTDYEARYAPVKFLFARRGSVRVALRPVEENEVNTGQDELIGKMMDAGAEDFEETAIREGDGEAANLEMEFWCEPQDLAKVTAAAMESGLCQDLISSELVYTPTEKGDDLDEEVARSVEELIEKLGDHEDVLRVWTTHTS